MSNKSKGDAPSEPGLYWWKGGDDYPTHKDWVVVQVSLGVTKRLLVDGPAWDQFVYVEYIKGEWGAPCSREALHKKSPLHK